MRQIEQMNPKLITNQQNNSFYKELKKSLETCNKFYFSVAFINFSGLQLLLDTFDSLDATGKSGKIITSTYLNFTDVKSLKKLTRYKNIDTQIYIADRAKGFHTKGYIFEYDDYYKVIIGSSNITQSALKSNYEWNVRYESIKEGNFIKEIIKEFNSLWSLTSQIYDDFLTQYSSFLNDVKDFTVYEKKFFEKKVAITPNRMQIEALKSLSKLRKNRQDKALIIAATGTGKTFLSAFDVKQFVAKKVLFIVHREVILKSAKESFERIISNKTSTVFQGQHKETEAEFTFAMQQTLSRLENLKLFNPDEFDYIIIDEAHRSFSETYQRIINYFNPEFLLGMTATPERTDGGNIFELFNNNIALEVRLRDALYEDLVIPFHYFGITDASTDLKDKDLTKIDDLAKTLSIQDRVDLIIEKMEHYSFSGDKRKALGFCVSRDHAKYMADSFNAWGYNSLFLTGESSNKARKNAIDNLENTNHPLEFIFTIDVFNEGIDIPTVNLVLMLRPTQSPIIFTQQLGRGLRKHPEKEFLTVLDFIGNHNKSFLIPIALSGTKYYEKDSLKILVDSEFDEVPGCTNIHLDKIVKDQILKQLDTTNFTYMKYLRKEYQDFKNVLGGKTPSIVDFFKYDSSPDVIKFIDKKHSYYEFINHIEKESIKLSDSELEILRVIDKSLPIKRINEFVILLKLFNDIPINKEMAKQEISKLVTNTDLKSIQHSFDFLSGKFFSQNEANKYDFISSRDGFLYIKESTLSKFSKLFFKLINESLEYGILRYQDEFYKEFPDYPYLKLYNHYKMKDMGLLSNYNKSFSSIRGSGVWHFNDHYYLFVDLHKGENIQESIDYKDRLISRTEMQWETQNKTAQNTRTGKELCHPERYNKTLHMFVRKAKKIGSQKLDFIYIGKVSPKSYKGNKPITLKLKLNTELPKHIFKDLTQII